MALLTFIDRWKQKAVQSRADGTGPFNAWSIEVMPRTAAKVDDFKAILPVGTRVYIAHIAGTPIEDMIATAKRISDEGFTAMPHFPARSIPDVATLENWIKRYSDEAGVTEALLLGGGETRPAGSVHSSVQLIETGLFDKYGFKRLHVAGHPEGNKDIDKDGSTHQVDAALKWKTDFSTRTDAQMAIVTQFGFDARAVTDWADRIQNAGVTLPIHVGIAGPAKLQTLIKFAISCGVGPSLKVLQKRALDVTRLLTPYEPTEFVSALGHHKAQNPNTLIEQLHVFPLGGIRAGADWMNRNVTDQASKRSA
ncbi:methylenetetrahydrofolate reductase [Agrobacterium sp. rho-13.3]|uniref:methylenetetrahydrofolate reductase n=1 Tax=Agrobacterium sp. rho-13.3 TaxID=3072980 RepID=UPI002A0DE4A7|nr:methylenetetrahydrofolate reductase [Agrobacterium sp. rho-13.3]MDX8306642.1 methylenetetrahydrofolate reductase [Agrobacterium sp. rho-13.3]MDX8307027.1 methylenetetrahydrofolate reductase [Agrobacterium sp. rho-13.3]